MIRLVCIDVDGTLVGSDGGVHPRVWAAAERARAAGVRLAVCSGRPGFGGTRILAERLDAEGWHSFQNGASVLHLPTGRSLSTPIPAATLAMLLARARATGRLLEFYTDADYAFEGPPRRAREHAGLLGVPFAERPIAALAGTVVRAQWLLPFSQTEEVLAEPHTGLEVSPSTSPVMPDTQFINLTLAGIDKATAVRALAAEYGVPLSQVMFVGDGENDAPAMRIVGAPVAMANAEPVTLAAATRIVPHVDEGGLADALRAAIAQ